MTFLLTKHEVRSKIKEQKAEAIKTVIAEADIKELTLTPKTNSFEHKLE